VEAWLYEQPGPPSTANAHLKVLNKLIPLRKAAIDTDPSGLNQCCRGRRGATGKRNWHGRQWHIGVLTDDVVVFIAVIAVAMAPPAVVKITPKTEPGGHRMRSPSR